MRINFALIASLFIFIGTLSATTCSGAEVPFEVLREIETIKQEVHELRGKLEEQQHLLADISNAKQFEEKNIPIDTEQAAYEEACKLVDSKQYQEALIAFQDFVWKYPESRYVPNAHYWIGEIYLLTWQENKEDQLNLEKAISSFKTVTLKYNSHNKAVDALLKLGLIEFDRENWDLAKEYFIKLKDQYPNSSRAQIAESKLQRLKEREG